MLVAATRGNHGQSSAFAAKFSALGSSSSSRREEKNAPMQALGAELVVHGAEFSGSPRMLPQTCTNGIFWQSLYPFLVMRGEFVRTGAFFGAGCDLCAYRYGIWHMPRSGGSSRCTGKENRGRGGGRVGCAGLLALAAQGSSSVTSGERTRIADGMACRTPILSRSIGYAAAVEVSDDEIEEAMRLYFAATHENVAEHNRAAALAAALQGHRSSAANASHWY